MGNVTVKYQYNEKQPEVFPRQVDSEDVKQVVDMAVDELVSEGIIQAVKRQGSNATLIDDKGGVHRFIVEDASKETKVDTWELYERFDHEKRVVTGVKYSREEAQDHLDGFVQLVLFTAPKGVKIRYIHDGVVVTTGKYSTTFGYRKVKN